MFRIIQLNKNNFILRIYLDWRKEEEKKESKFLILEINILRSLSQYGSYLISHNQSVFPSEETYYFVYLSLLFLKTARFQCPLNITSPIGIRKCRPYNLPLLM